MSIPFRVGQGFDVHALVEGRPLIIGGVTIPHTHGLLGHSDADVLLHAVTDALLGAAGLGDIGGTSGHRSGFQGRRQPQAAARGHGARAPGWLDAGEHRRHRARAGAKIGPHAAAMVANIAADTGLAVTEVNIKAKTNEGLGYLGRKEGIAATVVALLARADSPA